MSIREADLDHAFADAVADNRSLQLWLLSRGRFARYSDATLMVDSQREARRTAKHWWKHWWCRMPDGSEGETDVFTVWQCPDMRFALHIENKPPHGKLSIRQAAAYRQRAALKANDAGWLSYIDFETILLAPTAFIEQNETSAVQFDRCITYEDVSSFVPLFGDALVAAASE